MKKIHIIGGGTFSHVRNHFALAAPAFGHAAKTLNMLLDGRIDAPGPSQPDFGLELHLTAMAGGETNRRLGKPLVTNDDVSQLLDNLIEDPETRVIILNAALCDYDGVVDGWERIDPPPKWARGPMKEQRPVESGKYARRLKTSDGQQTMRLTPAEKLVGKVRKERKDIFLVAFKTTTDATPDEQYLAGLDLLKKNSANLVLANDTVTRHNMIIAPEETRYHETENRMEVLMGLVQMVLARMGNTFTRSTVREGELVSFQNDPRVPDNLRQVVNYLVERGAYKPFNGATAGHFAVRLDEQHCLTSRRKTNYTVEGGLDLVKVEYDGLNKVIAYGAKPSVGGQSQRIVFEEHEGLDCIVHAHVPLRIHDVETAPFPIASQWQNECGSHQCGKNTSNHLHEVEPGIWAVMLANHGPNVVFSRDTPADRVISFIERHFNLSKKTGGLVEPIREEAFA